MAVAPAAAAAPGGGRPLAHRRRRRQQRRTLPQRPRASTSPSPAPAPAPARETLDAAVLRAKLEHAASTGTLDLSECGLAEVPPEVFDLGDAVEDLSLAGNELTALPPALGRLTGLRRLQVSGNRLRALPDAVGALGALEGLWAHGNLLGALPGSLGDLPALEQLALAGNRLAGPLPEALGRLPALVELSLAGNRLESLPPSAGGWASLKRLALHGNALRALPDALGGLPALEELWVQGNAPLRALPGSLGAAPALRQLGAADCALAELPASLGGAPRLEAVTAYGNALERVPRALLAAPALRQLWLEGNPLAPGEAAALLAAVAAGGRLAALGLDDAQLARAPPGAAAAAGAALQRSGAAPRGAGPGYWKLERWADAAGGGGAAAPGGGAAAGTLVVAFGSAPGTPNWGGVLRRVRASLAARPDAAFDVLYVVDPARRWYDGGGGAAEFGRWDAALAAAAAPYRAVVAVGDSMGATAALLFGRHAAAVHAFCPQVELSTASIRPGEGAGWFAALRARARAGAAACLAAGGRVAVHTGSWPHDVAQAGALGPPEGYAPAGRLRVEVYGEDSHRLALALDRAGRLEPLLRAAVVEAAAAAGGGGGAAGGVESGAGAAPGGVRLGNLL